MQVVDSLCRGSRSGCHRSKASQGQTEEYIVVTIYQSTSDIFPWQPPIIEMIREVAKTMLMQMI